MKIGITKIPRPINIIQSSSIKQKKGFNKSSLASFMGGIWGIVKKLNSEDVTVDVEMRNGIELRHIKVRSLEWAGHNSNRAFGERDLPPLDSKVFIMLPDGPDNLDTAFVFCSVIDTVWEIGEKAREELALSGKNREYLRINEVGWKFNYDKDTGDLTIESPEVTDKIIVNLDRTNKKAKVSVGNIEVEINNGQVNIAGSTKSLVTYAALNTALQNMVSWVNSHTHPTAPTGPISTPTPPPLSLDISSSEAQKAKTS